MSYTQIQCIGFVAEVNYDETTTISLGESGSCADTEIYTGKEDDKLDIRDKLARYLEAAKLAMASQHYDDAPTTLKLFMGPEFYFRGKKGTYEIENVSEIFTKLRAEFNDVKWKDWLFIPGTVIAHLPHKIKKKKFAQALRSVEYTKLHEEIFNTCMYQKGGYVQADDQHEGVIFKEYVSHIDFLNTKKNPDWKDTTDRRVALNSKDELIRLTTGSRDLDGGKDHAREVEEEGSNLAGGSVFTVDGVRIGLEVCLDHAKERLWQAVAGVPGVKQVAPVQLQLIPSAGMSIEAPSVATVNHGIVFNVDGLRGQYYRKYSLPDLQTAGIQPPCVVRCVENGHLRPALKEIDDIVVPGSFNDKVMLFASLALPTQ